MTFGMPELDELGLTEAEMAELIDGLTEPVAFTLAAGTARAGADVPSTPAAQAVELDPQYRLRPHIDYLSERLAAAAADVAAGQSRFMRISMPPRMGKSTLTSIYLPVWLLRKHPDWKLGLISHSPELAAAWGRDVRAVVEEHGPRMGVSLAKDAGAVSNWKTTKKGGVISRSAPGQSLTGLGFRILIIDDVVKDFVTAHSEKAREAVWTWWTSNAFTRLEAPFLVCVVGTRWHEDDFLGRIGSTEYEGNSGEWEVIELPALAEENDVIGRMVGEPLLSPINDETAAEALKRWASIKTAVGSYNWQALYQQSPRPAKGAIFDTSKFRFWTSDPTRELSDNTRWVDPSTMRGGQWLDSWDMAFKATDTSDWVVGQRWMRSGPDRFLIAQQRGRWPFTQVLERVSQWRTEVPDPELNPYGNLIYKTVIEDKANGPAVIDTLKHKISGLAVFDPKTSKEARAWSVTPECESGNVWLPHPGDPGNEWVVEVLLPELRDFPHGKHDDQVDAFTQGLLLLRSGEGLLTFPRTPGRDTVGGMPVRVPASRVAAARSVRTRSY